jgi:hypothetical protein
MIARFIIPSSSCIIISAQQQTSDSRGASIPLLSNSKRKGSPDYKRAPYFQPNAIYLIVVVITTIVTTTIVP